jgi:hypothetical protein
MWEQFFEHGYVAWDSTDRRVYVFCKASDTWRAFPTPEAQISTGSWNFTINESVLDDLLGRISSPGVRQQYEDLVRTHRLRGGIGTIVVQEKLLDCLGPPLATATTQQVCRDGEHPLPNAAFISGGATYDLIAGLTNQQGDFDDAPLSQAVYVMFKDGTYVRHPVAAHP